MDLWVAAGSLAAVLALAGIARLLGLGGTRRIDSHEEAMTLAGSLVSGFAARTAILAADGMWAVAGDGEGQLVLIEPLGARYRAHPLPAHAATWQAGGGEPVLILKLDRHDVRTLPLAAADRDAALALAIRQG